MKIQIELAITVDSSEDDCNLQLNKGVLFQKYGDCVRISVETEDAEIVAFCVDAEDLYQAALRFLEFK